MHPIPEHIKPCKVMVFVDGENLSIRWKNQLGNLEVPSHVRHEPDVFVWSPLLNMHHHLHCNVVRKSYFTSAPGDAVAHDRIHDRLKELDIESPQVFPRTKGKRSKRVDITLSVEMLTHAYQKNYDAAVLVAGDEDYVPLVQAVKNAGPRVFLWFVEDGLSPSLRRSADYYFDVGKVLCNPDADRYFGRY